MTKIIDRKSTEEYTKELERLLELWLDVRKKARDTNISQTSFQSLLSNVVCKTEQLLHNKENDFL